MAKRGTPLPFSLREEIRLWRTEESIRRVANRLRVSINTVRKYEAKFDTNLKTKAG